MYLVSHAEGKKRPELQQILKRDCGVSQSGMSNVLEALEAVLQNSSGQSAAAQLLKKVHYSQLINFDFKFASKFNNVFANEFLSIVTTADSMI